jgi:hypothetical protein
MPTEISRLGVVGIGAKHNAVGVLNKWKTPFQTIFSALKLVLCGGVFFVSVSTVIS